MMVRNKSGKFMAGMEMVLVIVSIFALCYFVDLSNNSLPLVSAADDEDEGRDSRLRDFLDRFGGGTLIENESWSSYAISSSSDGVGCCFVNEDGQVCGTSAPENCIVDSPFAEGALCAETSFCEKGCCYDDATGTYDKNVLEFACPTEWVEDANCNLPGANLGCCVLGTETIFETRGQCEVDSLVRALGNEGVVDWRGDVGEGACLYLSATQREGACVLGEGGCKFVSEADCFSYGGDFAEGSLCTAPDLNTSCEMTEQTRCVDGKDGVYFVDSCGNVANVYDSERAEDASYWDGIVYADEVCGSTDFENGNANSASCGNCNRFAGGICASAGEDNFNVDLGGFYCRDMSCMFDGVNYDNGESWCVYDGSIGDGTDVVGSRHWKYVCSQGVVQIEPCADYRNQICIQSKEFEVDGNIIEFENAACVANNWRECINLNSDEEDAMEECSEAVNCRVDTIAIADKFTFDVCLPKYPGGFALNDERYQQSAERLCGMASQTCTVIQKPKKWGGCEYVSNENCLYEGFAQGMNEFCTGLGDCGGSVNIVGEYSENYNVLRDSALSRGMFLSDSWIARLVALATPVPGQYAEVEDYSEYLEAAGIWGVPGAPGAAEEDTSIEDGMGMVRYGLGGISSAMEFAASGQILGQAVPGVVGGFLPGAALPAVPAATIYSVPGMASATVPAVPATSMAASASAFAGAAMGAGIGMMAGMMLAKQLGLSEGGSMLMGIGGAMVGAYIMISNNLMGAGALGPMMGPMLGALLWVGIALIVISLFFGMGDCPPIEIAFECEPWQPLTGGDSCEECNGDPLKPCSRYRCESLGAGCELLNEGSGDELCVDANPNDATPPVIRRNIGVGLGNTDYEDEDTGFSVVSPSGGCLEAYAPLAFGIVTSEPAQCRFDIAEKEFEEMSFSIGSNSYSYNHTGIFSLPDPSHGESQGVGWSGELSLFIKCQDRYGLVSPGFYEIKTCVAEGDDVTAPRVVTSEPVSGGIVGVDVVSQDVLIVTNEFSSCRWSLSDVGYFDMENSMECLDSLGHPSNVLGYECSGAVPVGNSSDYYVRCMDQPWEESSNNRNANVESFVFSLRKPTSKISIDKIRPDTDFEISTDFTTIDLKVATSGGGEYHFCSYSFSGYDSMIEMFETGNERTHGQRLNVGPGGKKIYVECRDETGDFARNVTSFDIIRDSSAPAVARVWQSGETLYIVTTEAAECRYSVNTCRFAWVDGVSIGSGMDHSIGASKGETYYVKCEDEFGNSPNGCSVEVMAT